MDHPFSRYILPGSGFCLYFDARYVRCRKGVIKMNVFTRIGRRLVDAVVSKG